MPVRHRKRCSYRSGSEGGSWRKSFRRKAILGLAEKVEGATRAAPTNSKPLALASDPRAIRPLP
jgi:hypothetical protein